MLLELRIKNFALIDNVEMSFSKGFNVLTGETGTGKSILIDSINFILGDKQSKDIIRIGQDFAYVEGIFDNPSKTLLRLLSENGVDKDELIIISREISVSGRSISRINGKTVTNGFLKQVGRLLIDIHGQHEHQSLLNDDNHMDILDLFCKEKLKGLKEEFLSLYNETRKIERDIEKLTENEQNKLRRIDLLSFQTQEITKAKLRINEDEELSRQREILSNAEKINSILMEVYDRLYQGYDSKSAHDEIGKVVVELDSIERFDDKIKAIKESLEEVYYKLEGIVEDVREYKDRINFNSEEFEELEVRLDLINKLKRKYGSTIEEILIYNDEAMNELSQIQKSEESLKELNEKKKENKSILYQMAKKIREIRLENAEKLSSMIMKELKYLGMEKAVFKVEVKEMEKLKENGMDNVYFTMTANPGEPLKSLSKVASGGEMSRIMLAIKSVIADIDRIPTLIFDEIDIGISGRTAQAVAEKMCLISKGHQILCVTHLPQIASMADNHFQIQKLVEKEKTTTKVFRLELEKRIDELARMLGGAVLTELTRNHAKEVFELAMSMKEKIRKSV